MNDLARKSPPPLNGTPAPARRGGVRAAPLMRPFPPAFLLVLTVAFVFVTGGCAATSGDGCCDPPAPRVSLAARQVSPTAFVLEVTNADARPARILGASIERAVRVDLVEMLGASANIDLRHEGHVAWEHGQGTYAPEEHPGEVAVGPGETVRSEIDLADGFYARRISSLFSPLPDARWIDPGVLLEQTPYVSFSLGCAVEGDGRQRQLLATVENTMRGGPEAAAGRRRAPASRHAGVPPDVYEAVFRGWRESVRDRLDAGFSKVWGGDTQADFLGADAAGHLPFLRRMLRADMFVSQLLDSSPLYDDFQQRYDVAPGLQDRQRDWLAYLDELAGPEPGLPDAPPEPMTPAAYEAAFRAWRESVREELDRDSHAVGTFGIGDPHQLKALADQAASHLPFLRREVERDPHAVWVLAWSPLADEVEAAGGFKWRVEELRPRWAKFLDARAAGGREDSWR